MNKDADVLFTNAIVLTMDSHFKIFEPGAVAVKGDAIVAVGDEALLKKSIQAKEIIDCGGKVLMPGLVNAHTHVSMNLLRGLADDLRLDVWLMGYIMPVERDFVSPDFVYLGALLGAAELIRSGVTCFNDMYYYENEVARAAADAGLRAICGQSTLKFPSPDAQSYEESLQYAREFIQRWKGHPLVIPTIAPHAPYTCTDEIFRLSSALAAEFDVPLHTHIAETASEVENMRKEMGMPQVPYLKKQNLFDAKVIAAHCVYIDEGEMHTLAHYNVGVAHNPSSNLKIASGIAPIHRMLELGLNVGIGTDGVASNNDLDMFEEMRLASFISKVSTNNPTSLPARTVVNMATHMGAKALHIDHITGSLEVGKRADLILIDINNLHNMPRFRRDEQSIYAQIVYAAHATDVTDVMVNGRWLMKKSELLTLNEDDLLSQAEVYAKRIDTFLIEREKSVLSKLIAIEGVKEEESFEIQTKVRVKDADVIFEAVKKPAIEVLVHRRYHQYDTYFYFPKKEQGFLRYREDEIVEMSDKEISKETPMQVRYRLTLLGEAAEGQIASDVLLFRSRYMAPATHSLRFYREYFDPSGEKSIEKERERWRVLYKGTEFYINFDRLKQPDLGYFLETKTRTWSRRDAENKAELATELMRYILGSESEEILVQDYFELAQAQKQ